MKRAMPEFAAIPIVLVGIGLTFLIMYAANAGAVAWVALGIALLVALVGATVVFMRQPRGPRLEEAPPASARDAGRQRVLLVVDAACSQQDLAEFASAAGNPEFFVVAPAVSSRVARWTGDERSYAHAQEQLDATLQALSDLGFQAAGHVGPHDPLQAADDALREYPAGEVVFVLHGSNETDWLERGVVDEARRRYAVPVRELVRAAGFIPTG